VDDPRAVDAARRLAHQVLGGRCPCLCRVEYVALAGRWSPDDAERRDGRPYADERTAGSGTDRGSARVGRVPCRTDDGLRLAGALLHRRRPRADERRLGYGTGRRVDPQRRWQRGRRTSGRASTVGRCLLELGSAASGRRRHDDDHNDRRCEDEQREHHRLHAYGSARGSAHGVGVARSALGVDGAGHTLRCLAPSFSEIDTGPRRSKTRHTC
jgi:hypothetical protein